jgi:hypothetical protein
LHAVPSEPIRATGILSPTFYNRPPPSFSVSSL